VFHSKMFWRQKKCHPLRCSGTKTVLQLKKYFSAKICHTQSQKSVTLQDVWAPKKCHPFRCLGTTNFHNQLIQFRAKKCFTQKCFGAKKSVTTGRFERKLLNAENNNPNMNRLYFA